MKAKREIKMRGKISFESSFSHIQHDYYDNKFKI